MSLLRASMIAIGSLAVCAMLTGCESLKHNLHPERLWRLNRGPAVGQVDASFSLSDDQATEKSETWRAIVRDEQQSKPSFKD